MQRTRAVDVPRADSGAAAATDSLDFSGRVAVITGGGSGIGAATARRFAVHGASVVLAGRTPSTLQEVKRELAEQYQTACLVVPTDVKDEVSVAALAERALNEFGHVDVLVNCAGGSRNLPLEAMPTRMWDSAFELNTRGPFLLMRELAAHMIERQSGSIVNVSSLAGSAGLRGAAAYSAAKRAVQHLTVVVAAEWGRHGIRVNCVAPGFIGSESAVAAWKAADIDVDDVRRRIPLRRIGTPSEVAAAIAFLASDAAAFVTGQTLSVDGGPILEGADY